MNNEPVAPQDSTDSRFERFSRRLDAILGKDRIRRKDKVAKAEAAMLAVDELVDSIQDDISGR